MERTSTKTSGTNANNSVLKMFTLSQTFKIGFFTVHYYAVILIAAILAGYFVGLKRIKKIGIEKKLYEEIVFWTVLWGIVGARLYYVIFYSSFYKNDFLEIFKIWHGGQAIYGALIGGFLTLLYFAHKNKIPLSKLTDLAAFSLPLSQAIGRWGNFINYEAFGNPTNLSWKIFIPEKFRPAGFAQYSYFHPTFLYESLWNLAVFAILIYISKKTQKNGYLTLWYLILYSIGRFAIEAIRLDSAYWYGFKVDQIWAALIIVIASAIMYKKYESQTR